MKMNVTFQLILCCFFFNSLQAQIFWTENFENGCNKDCSAATYSSANGSWSVVSTGVNGATPNEWFVSCEEVGNTPGCCSFKCSGGCRNNDESLHIGLPGEFSLRYNSAMANVTNKRAESPIINGCGYSNITINFDYVSYGDNCGSDKTSLMYSPDSGNTWMVIDSCLTTLCCGSIPCTMSNGSGEWASYGSAALPASATNNPGIKIGFQWTNDNDGVSSFISFAVNDVTLSGTPASLNADFSASDTSICFGDSVTLTDQSTGTPACWKWTITPLTFTYLNGTSAKSQHPKIVFTALGNYTVKLNISLDSIEKISYISVNSIPTVVCGSDISICEKDSGSLTAVGDSTYLYSWSPASTLSNSSIANPKASPGTTTQYICTVTDTNGCQSTDTVIVSVNMNPTIGFTGIPLIIAEGDTVLFTNSTTGAASYVWDFGDGTTTSTAVDPSHIYTLVGTFSVQFMATSDSGCTDSLTKANYVRVDSIINAIRNISSSRKNQIHLYPNPINGRANIVVHLPEKANINLAVYNYNELEVATVKQGTISAGTYTYTIDANEMDLPSGFYLMILTVDGVKYVSKFTVIR